MRTASHPDMIARLPRKPSRRTLLATVAGTLVLGSAVTWYGVTLGDESTDDAQIDGEVVAVPARISGTVKRIAFVENQTVTEGDILAELDDDITKARLAEAEAALASAEASADAAEADARVAEENATGNKAATEASVKSNAAAASRASEQIAEAAASLASREATLRQAKLDAERYRALYNGGAITKQAMDQTETALLVAESNATAARARLVTLQSGVAEAKGRVAEAQARARQSSDVASFIAQARARASAARAQVATARAARDLAALDLSYTRIRAPHDGVVSKKTIAEGQAVATGQAIVQLVTPGVWVTANFKETQLENMRVGQPVAISVDAYPSAKIRGEVESLSGGTGSRFTLLPPDNASGNYTKIVQRLPVRIRVVKAPADVALRPGLSVDATVNTRG